MGIKNSKQRISALVKEYEKKIEILARRMVRDKEHAREAAQETWYQIIKSLPSFTGRSRIGIWIYTIARRKSKTVL